MVTSAVGDVVLVPFPFSDLSSSKLRPALIVAEVGRGDWVCVQITSNPYSDSMAIQIGNQDFSHGSLQVVSYARPGKIFTANEILFKKVIGQLSKSKRGEIISGIVVLLKRDI